MAVSHDIDDPNAYVFYRYHPSRSAAAIFTVLFAISTMFHVYQSYRKRALFMVPFIIGGIFETVGYIGRILSSNNQWELGPYIMQSLLLLLAPALFAASIYMVLGRIILLTDGEKFSLIRRTWLTKIFVGGDVLSFLLQSTGGALLSTADDKPDNLKLGENVIMGGLFAQIVFFGFFVVVAIIFQTRGRAHLETLEVPWYKHLVVLYVTSTLILIRSIFRVVEYIQGNDGYLMRMEVFLYVFDALLMFKVMLAMNVIHPGDIAPMLKQKEANSKGQAVEMDRQSPV